jgi:DNA-binding LacI/PurR family transcriptional regulator
VVILHKSAFVICASIQNLLEYIDIARNACYTIIKERETTLNRKTKGLKVNIMKKFRVEVTEAINTYCFTGEWDSDFCQENIEAETEEEAIEFAKDIFIDGFISMGNDDVDINDYIFRAKEIED